MSTATPQTVILTLILLASSGCGLTGVVGRAAGDASAVPPSSLSIMTANLQRNTRSADMRLLGDNIRADLGEKPDFILCQEVMFSPLGANRSSAAALARRIGYDWRGNPRGRGSLEGSAILSRYPFIFYDARTLKSSPSRWRLGFRRMSIMGEFAVPGVGRVRVVNVHFQDKPENAANRRAQLSETLLWIAAREKIEPAALTFLGGDFNAAPDSSDFDAIYAHPAITFQNFNTGRLSKFDKRMRSCVLRLDSIYVACANGDPITLESESILWPEGLRDQNGSLRYVSDHLPIMHTYSLRPETLYPERKEGRGEGFRAADMRQ